MYIYIEFETYYKFKIKYFVIKKIIFTEKEVVVVKKHDGKVCRNRWVPLMSTWRSVEGHRRSRETSTSYRQKSVGNPTNKSLSLKNESNFSLFLSFSLSSLLRVFFSATSTFPSPAPSSSALNPRGRQPLNLNSCPSPWPPPLLLPPPFFLFRFR